MKSQSYFSNEAKERAEFSARFEKNLRELRRKKKKETPDVIEEVDYEEDLPMEQRKRLP